MAASLQKAIPLRRGTQTHPRHSRAAAPTARRGPTSRATTHSMSQPLAGCKRPRTQRPPQRPPARRRDRSCPARRPTAARENRRTKKRRCRGRPPDPRGRETWRRRRANRDPSRRPTGTPPAREASKRPRTTPLLFLKVGAIEPNAVVKIHDQPPAARNCDFRGNSGAIRIDDHPTRRHAFGHPSAAKPRIKQAHIARSPAAPDRREARRPKSQPLRRPAAMSATGRTWRRIVPARSPVARTLYQTLWP